MSNTREVDRPGFQVKVRLSSLACDALDAVCKARAEEMGDKAGERGQTLEALIMAEALRRGLLVVKR